MKNTLLILLALGWLSINSIAVAQSPATIKKSDNDTLCQSQRIEVEIIGINGDHFNHPQHPENGIICPFVKSFKTNGYFAWYQWESSFKDNITNNPEYIMVHIDSCGYIKVTVGDNYGHTGSDSIWFHVRNANVPPMEDFIMEIDDDLHANFSGIATEDHYKLSLYRCFIPELFTYHEDFYLSPGEWVYNDRNAVYSEDTLWLYYIPISDICGSVISYIIPGLLLNTDGHDLTMRTILQRDDATFYINENFVYLVFTVDEDGNRQEFTDNNGNLLTLQPEATSWPIPNSITEQYLQCGVAKLLEDGSYQLLSLSNKVENPWLIDNTTEKENDDPFSIFPNPSHGLVTVVGKGTLSVVNMLGQIVLRQEIDGESTVELPRGIYFVKLGGAVRKVVVE